MMALFGSGLPGWGGSLACCCRRGAWGISILLGLLHLHTGQLAVHDAVHELPYGEACIMS